MQAIASLRETINQAKERKGREEKMLYKVLCRTVGVYAVTVEAESEKQAEQFAEKMWEEAHFGDLDGPYLEETFILAERRKS